MCYHQNPSIGLECSLILRHIRLFSSTVEDDQGNGVCFVHAELPDVFYFRVKYQVRRIESGDVVGSIRDAIEPT